MSDFLGAGESIETAGAYVTNQGAGMYTFTPRPLTTDEQTEHDRGFAAWLEEFNTIYMSNHGEPCSAYLIYKKREAAVNGQG